MADLADWPYYKIITITGQAGSGTDYQVELEIGDSAGGDFHLEGHCTNFPQDIRITDDDGTTLLDHFVEDLTADPIVVQVEVKDDLGSNQTIRVYYGKSGETTASNITNTFPDFSDNFPGSSIDTGKWDGKTSNAAVSGGIMSYGGDGTADSMNSILQFGSSVAVRSKLKVLTPSTYYHYMGLKNPATTHGARTYSDYNSLNRMYTKDGTTESYVDTNTPLNSWYVFDLKINGGSSTSWSFDGTAGTNSPKTTNPPNANDLEISFIGRGSSVVIQSEWVIVRKYNSPEPAFSSAGAEQSAAGAPTGVFYGPLVGPFGGPI